MQLTGNVARTLGQAVLALGIIAVVLGVTGLVMGGLLLRDAVEDSRSSPPDGFGEVLEGLLASGMVLTVSGTVAVVAGIVLLGVGRALRERLERRLAAAAAGPPKAGIPATDA